MLHNLADVEGITTVVPPQTSAPTSVAQTSTSTAKVHQLVDGVLIVGEAPSSPIPTKNGQDVDQ